MSGPLIDLKQLKVMTQSQADVRHKQRHTAAERALDKGIAALEQAHEESFARKEPLLEACTQFIETIRLNRTDVRPYVGLTYLFSILADYETAHEYLSEALRLEPNHEAARALEKVLTIDQISAHRNTSDTEPLAITFQTQTHGLIQPDFDALHDQLSAGMLEQVRAFMTHQLPPPEPTLISAQKEMVDHTCQQIFMVCQMFKERIKLIEQDRDATDLWHLFKPLETQLKRYQQAMITSQQFLHLQEEIEDLDTQIQDATAAYLDEHQSVHWEALYDVCDRLADQLDDLGKKHNVAILETQYEKVVAALSALQELVDA